ncbi:MAG TPA: hypothetical protein VK390_14325 [Propionibacteriaceae bacterium]|nr:hypothetical protein [Propionibacteriaceae bacterium]
MLESWYWRNHDNPPEHGDDPESIEDVFAFIADLENVPTWNYAIVETKKTSPGPVGVGNHLPKDPFHPRQQQGRL